MSKAFTTEENEVEEDDFDDADEIPSGGKNYMTPAGYAALQKEMNHLIKEERPKVVEIVSWAAGNGDRSENGDYIYGKKRLREIDRRLRYLIKRIDNAEVVDPAKQQNLDRVFFGATVTFAGEDDQEQSVTIVGVDEADFSKGKISWLSPLARTLMKTKVGDVVERQTAKGREEIEIISIAYRAASEKI